jgi:hypothetical protein
MICFQAWLTFLTLLAYLQLALLFLKGSKMILTV